MNLADIRGFCCSLVSRWGHLKRVQMAGMAKSRPNTVSLRAMNAEEGAVQLAKSMQLYFRFAMADMAGPEARKQALRSTPRGRARSRGSGLVLAIDGPKAFMPLILLLLLAISYVTRPVSHQWQAKVTTV